MKNRWWNYALLVFLLLLPSLSQGEGSGQLRVKITSIRVHYCRGGDQDIYTISTVMRLRVQNLTSQALRLDPPRIFRAQIAETLTAARRGEWLYDSVWSEYGATGQSPSFLLRPGGTKVVTVGYDFLAGTKTPAVFPKTLTPGRHGIVLDLRFRTTDTGSLEVSAEPFELRVPSKPKLSRCDEDENEQGGKSLHNLE